MRRVLASSFGLWLLWAVLVIAFMLLKPPVFGFAFWVFVALVVVVGGAQMLRSRSESRADRADFVQWSDRLTALGVELDVPDDGHLFEWLGPSQWQQVFASLEEMPAGSRSLRQAILANHPEVLQ